MVKESPLEAEAAMLIARAGLPPPIRQFPFGSEVGRKWIADFAWNLSLGRVLLLEADGGGFVRGRHHRNSGREDDMVRDAYCALRGWPLLRATPNLLRQGYAVRWLQNALGRNSYIGPALFPTGSALRPREAARRRVKARAKRALAGASRRRA